MKTNLMQCVMAYQAVTGMMNTACDYKTAYALVMLKRRLDPHVQFFIRREQELVDEYAARDGKGGVVWDTPTSFRFADTARAAEYAEKRAELGTIEVTDELKKLHVPVPEHIMPAQLEALEPFFVFEEAEK